MNPLTDFGRKLFSLLAGQPKNVVVSPLSIYSAFSMVLLGAKGATRDEIVQALHLKEPAKTKNALKTMQESFSDSQKNKVLQLAANTFLSKAYPINASFITDMKDVFRSEITSKQEFFAQSEESAKIINDWVASHTDNKVQNLLPPSVLNGNVLGVLISAVYFKANWENPFDAKQTEPMEFFATGDAKGKKVPTMIRRTTKEKYGENQVAKWVSLAYANPNGAKGAKVEFEAFFVLPKTNQGDLGAVSSFLFSGGKGFELPTSATKLAMLAIPKFKLEFGLDLIPVMQQLGIKNLFIEEASDLTGVSPVKPLFVSAALHKAVVEVDEVGTVAAAASAVVIMARGRAPEQKDFIANQPFFFVIMHVPTNSAIFMAKVCNPAES